MKILITVFKIAISSKLIIAATWDYHYSIRLSKYFSKVINLFVSSLIFEGILWSSNSCAKTFFAIVTQIWIWVASPPSSRPTFATSPCGPTCRGEPCRRVVGSRGCYQGSILAIRRDPLPVNADAPPGHLQVTSERGARIRSVQGACPPALLQRFARDRPRDPSRCRRPCQEKERHIIGGMNELMGKPYGSHN